MIVKMNNLIRYVNDILIFVLVSSCHVSLSTISARENQEIDINSCSKLFKCDNGQCIEKSFLCDGIFDCEDKSDETRHHCSNIPCEEQFFRCDYGGCIDRKYLCDGLKQCNDGSDESTRICKKTIDEDRIDIQKRRPRAANNSCAVPASSPDKTITYRCNGKPSSTCVVKGFVQESTIASVECNPDYSTTNETYLESGCLDKKWIPPIAKCIKKCEKLTPTNVDLLCLRKGIEIPCDLNSLLVGTVIRPTCKYLHTFSSFAPDYIEITCKDDGKWDKPLFSCTPQCGRPYSEAATLIKGGHVERFGDSPWHVAIYNPDKELICGGTIINPQIILSAAHCFGENATSNANAAKYEIVVSKFSRNYSVNDNQNQKVHKIKELRYSKKGYIGLNNHYAADIVILILQQPVTISPTVLPACIDWTSLNKGISPLEDTPAKVVGWGINDTGDYSEKLLTVNLPYISHERCLRIVPDDFKPFVTLDKFCAGTENGIKLYMNYLRAGGVSMQQTNPDYLKIQSLQTYLLCEGPGVLQGDSGGGLLFRENGLYYLRGIVSLKQQKVTSIAAFTDLADHIQWILSVVNEVKQGLIDQDSTLQSKTKLRVSSNDTSNMKNSTTIALKNCEKYSTYATDCIYVVTPNKGATKASPKEYPHNAYIGIGDVFEDVEWKYSGSLISEKFVLSVAHYTKTSYGESKWVLLGELDISSKNDDASPVIYSIVKQYLHPDYKPNSVYNDIALFQLNASVVISPYIRPACLYTSTFNPVNTEGKVTAFGVAAPGEQNSDHLLRTTVTILNDGLCRSKYKPSAKIERGYDSNSMVCVGNSSTQENLCVGISGSPLQFPKGGQPCMTTIYGISALGSSFCEGPDIYIKIPYYMDWIQSVVWP